MRNSETFRTRPKTAPGNRAITGKGGKRIATPGGEQEMLCLTEELGKKWAEIAPTHTGNTADRNPFPSSP